MKMDRIEEVHRVLCSFPSHPVTCAMTLEEGICLDILHVKAIWWLSKGGDGLWTHGYVYSCLEICWLDL